MKATRRPRRQAAMFRMKTGLLRDIGVENTKRIIITGTSIDAKGVAISMKVSDGWIAAMKFVPGGGAGGSCGSRVSAIWILVSSAKLRGTGWTLQTVWEPGLKETYSCLFCLHTLWYEVKPTIIT